MKLLALRRILPVLLLILVSPAIGHAQFADETQSLFDISPSKVDRTTNQIVIEFKEEEVIEEVEADEVTDEGVCCELPEEERMASDICVNVICPATP